MIWKIGTTRILSWYADDFPSTDVLVELSRDGGDTWENIDGDTGILTNSGRYDYLVAGDASSDCLIRVTGQTYTDPVDGAVIDFTDLNYTSVEFEISATEETFVTDIYYTVDGSTPDATKTLYTGPFDVEIGTTIKAIAIQSGWIDSDIAQWAAAGGTTAVNRITSNRIGCNIGI